MLGGVKNFSVGICDCAPSTARSSFDIILGGVVQLVTCLATDTYLTADPGVASLIPAQSHTFLEIDHEMISTVILLPLTE